MINFGGKVLRSRLRYFVRGYPWLPAVIFICACIALILSLIAKEPALVNLFWLIISIACAFALGYAMRMRTEWPRLHELRRSQFAEVWDSLCPTPKHAEIMASGKDGEDFLRKSGMQVAQRIADRSALKPTDDVLEIACGVGRIGWAIAQMSRSWTGCDISANMISHARTRLVDHSNVQFVHLPSSGLQPVGDASVDVVYCTNALSHFDQTARWQYVLEAFRVLRPSGRLYLDTIALDSPEGWAMIKNNLNQRMQGLEPPYAPLPSTPDELSAYFGEAGFVDVQIKYYDSLLTVTGVKFSS